MTGSILGMPLSEPHGRLYGVTRLRCSSCAPAPPTWTAALVRFAAWLHSRGGGPYLQSRLAGSTSAIIACLAAQAPGTSHKLISWHDSCSQLGMI